MAAIKMPTEAGRQRERELLTVTVVAELLTKQL